MQRTIIPPSLLLLDNRPAWKARIEALIDRFDIADGTRRHLLSFFSGKFCPKIFGSLLPLPSRVPVRHCERLPPS